MDVMAESWAQQLGSLNIPSLHITGSKDAIHDRSLATAARFFINPKVLIHSQTHVVPKLNRESPELTLSIKRFLHDMKEMNQQTKTLINQTSEEGFSLSPVSLT